MRVDGVLSGGTTYQVNDVTPPQAASILQGLVYRAPSLPVSGTNTYGFNISVTDGHGGSATNANAKVDVFSSSSAPTLSGTQSGQRFRLRERGVPSSRDGRRGDLVVEVRLVLPKILDERSKELLREFGRINAEDVRKPVLL
jgi:hypothetical protein